MNVVDPLQFAEEHWPDVTFYREQVEIIQSVQHNIETYCVAGNMLGKDFVAGFIIPWFFLTRHPCKIVTTSAKEDHLRVLWGEIKYFLKSSKTPWVNSPGDHLILNHREIRKVVNGEIVDGSYIIGMVAAEDKVAAMQGHHVALTGDGIPRTLFVADECSSVPDSYYEMADTWFNRMLAIGNPWDCENFFKRAVEGRPGTDDHGGDIKSRDNGHYDRKVIEIGAKDSPNVRYALSQIAKGKEPTNRIIIPGVKPYDEYVRNRRTWDKRKQCVSLDGKFYKGPDLKLYPSDWLDLAEKRAEELDNQRRVPTHMGVDAAEGGDKTAWVIIDEYGVIDVVSKKTPDTSVITDETIRLKNYYSVKPENIIFDLGGGGKQHVDRLRRDGYGVRGVAFQESASPARKRGMTPLEEKNLQDETKYVYKNRKGELYGIMRLLLDPVENPQKFGIPARFVAFRQQMIPIPLDYDNGGRLLIPPKKKPTKDSKIKTLIDLIGHSPDELEALLLAVYGMKKKARRGRVGVAF